MGGVLTCIHGHLVQVEGGGFQCDIAFLLIGLNFNGFRFVTNVRECDFCDGSVGGDFVFSVDVADDALLPFIDDHVDKCQGLTVFLVGDFSAEGVALSKQSAGDSNQQKKQEERKDVCAEERLHS